MNDQELQNLVENISLEFFKRPFSHRAYFNRRLKTTGGRYHLKDHNIDINPKMASQQEVLVGIIKHELVHYHLHMNGHSGKHNTVSFKRLLHQVGGSRYAPRVERNYKYEYQCSKRGLKYQRQRRIDTKRYVCSKCRGKLQLIHTN